MRTLSVERSVSEEEESEWVARMWSSLKQHGGGRDRKESGWVGIRPM